MQRHSAPISHSALFRIIAAFPRFRANYLLPDLLCAFLYYQKRVTKGSEQAFSRLSGDLFDVKTVRFSNRKLLPESIHTDANRKTIAIKYRGKQYELKFPAPTMGRRRGGSAWVAVSAFCQYQIQYSGDSRA